MNGQIQYGLCRPMTSAPTRADEPDEIRARAEALDLTGDIARGALPVVITGERLAAADVCHFAAPVRFGRRCTDQFGHLELTNVWLTFRAALEVSVAWREIARVHRSGREVEVELSASTRPLRFWCPCLIDAARAAVLAEHFSAVARGRVITTDIACPAWT